MTIIANKTDIQFEPKQAVDLATVAATETPENIKPNLGNLASLDYKPTEWRYLLRLSAAPTQGSATIKLKAGTVVIASETVSLNGITTASNRRMIALSGVKGEDRLSVEVDVTAAADAGITGTIDSTLSIDHPVVSAGC